MTYSFSFAKLCFENTIILGAGTMSIQVSRKKIQFTNYIKLLFLWKQQPQRY